MSKWRTHNGTKETKEGKRQMAQFTFKCPQCGASIEADNSLSGQVAECPCCEKGIVIPRNGVKRMVAGIPPRPAVPPRSPEKLKPQMTRPDANPSAQRRKTEYEQMVENEKERLKLRQRERMRSLIMTGVSLIVVALVGYYWWMSNRKFKVPDTFAQTEQVQIGMNTREDEEREKLRRERITSEEAEREKLRRERITREEAEREKRKAERERRTAEREKKLQAQREKAEAEKEARERIEEVENRFKGGALVFASDFPNVKSPLKKDGIFYAVGGVYLTDQKIYEAMVEDGKLSAVRTISLQGSPDDVDVRAFSDLITTERMLVMGEDGIVWFSGTGRAYWTEKITLANDEIVPSKVELKGLLPVLASWGKIPENKFRLTLKSTHGGRDVPIGIIEYGESVSAMKIRDALLPTMKARREHAANLPKPKLKKFKPTVVFYDGSIIRSELGGVTKVPRKFKHLGTKHQGSVKSATYIQAEERWKKLKAEAERQERERESVLQANRQLMQEYETNIRAILNREIRGEDIEAEVQKYILLVERSRSNLPRGTDNTIR